MGNDEFDRERPHHTCFEALDAPFLALSAA